MLNAKPLEDRRTSVRRRVYKTGQISFRGLHAAIDCVIRDISDTGARLSVVSPLGIPEFFDLTREGLPPCKCRVVWRKSALVGVEFVNAPARQP
jgi:hypothetical protein